MLSSYWCARADGISRGPDRGLSFEPGLRRGISAGAQEELVRSAAAIRTAG